MKNNPDTENPDMDIPDMENPPQINTNIINTKKQIDKDDKTYNSSVVGKRIIFNYG